MPTCWNCDGYGGRTLKIAIPVDQEWRRWIDCSVCGGIGILFADTASGREAIAANPKNRKAPDAAAR